MSDIDGRPITVAAAKERDRGRLFISCTPVSAEYSNRTACGGAETPHVTERTPTAVAPTSTAATCTDSDHVSRIGGNAFEDVGTWVLR